MRRLLLLRISATSFGNLRDGSSEEHRRAARGAADSKRAVSHDAQRAQRLGRTEPVLHSERRRGQSCPPAAAQTVPQQTGCHQ